MLQSDDIKTVIEALEKRQLGNAISILENYGYRFPEQNIISEIDRLKKNYILMLDYWAKGYKDPFLDEQYGHMLQQVYRLTSDIGLRQYIMQNTTLANIFRKSHSVDADWTLNTIIGNLQTFVSDEAMLELLPNATIKEQTKDFHRKHHDYLNSLFNYILTSSQWTDSTAEGFEQMLLMPTISSIDQQMIVSAIMINAVNNFDFNKFRVLANVYQKSTDENVRQRALVGWVFIASVGNKEIYPELNSLVANLLQDSSTVSELLELQIQLMYCVNAESDNRTIQKEIMPDLLKHNNLNITPKGLEEVEEDNMEDILGVGDSDRNIEKVEEGFRRMVDMHKSGSDIYFGGFSQMKRFPFFDTIINWFVPYYNNHPGISHITDNDSGYSLFNKMLSKGPFCNSDKYSFVLALQHVVNHLPENIKEMLNNEDAFSLNAMSDDSCHTATYIRRTYLQDIYRFYRLYPLRNLFRNIFENKKENIGTANYLLFTNDIFRGTLLESKFYDFTAFLLRKKLYGEAFEVLSNFKEVPDDFQYNMLLGTVLLSNHGDSRKYFQSEISASNCFAKALEFKSDIKVLRNYARALFYEGDILKAKEVYSILLGQLPDNNTLMLSYCICMTNLCEYDEAAKLLYRLYYNAPEDINISRVLARALVGDSKYEQAENLYKVIVKSENSVKEDWLNYGYCLWFAGREMESVDKFQYYLTLAYPDCSLLSLREHAEREIVKSELYFILEHEIGYVELQLMLDKICNIVS